MTKQQLIAGEKFEYTGPFKEMAGQVSLHLHDGYLVDPFGERFAFLMGEPGATFFCVWKPGYGTFTIHFLNCKIKDHE